MSFNRIIKKIKKERKELRLLVLGLDNAGKTTILHRLLGKPIEEVCPTFGYQIHSAEYGGHYLTILDIGGQRIFREYWSSYYEKIDGAIFVFDSSDGRSFVEHIAHIKSELVDTPLLILANKCDLNPGFTSADLGEELGEFLDARKDVRLVRCCGISGENLGEGVDWLLKRSMYDLTERINMDDGPIGNGEDA
jgi:ADP-ribosylation factor-like protein 2